MATGSLFQYQASKDAEPIGFLVTNAHVVAGKRAADMFFLLADDDGRPVPGVPYVYSTTHFEAMWFCHPNPAIDIAVASFDAVNADLHKRGLNIANRWINMDQAMVEQPFRPEIDEHPWVRLFGPAVDAVEEIVFVGYPSGYYDRENHLPVARRGITATPVFVSYGGEPAFLVDAAILPGSSGSPVFIVDSTALRRNTGRGGNERFIFLGVVTEFLPFKEPGKPPRVAQSEDDRLRLLTGLGLVYKPSCIVQTIEAFLIVQRAAG